MPRKQIAPNNSVLSGRSHSVVTCPRYDDNCKLVSTEAEVKGHGKVNFDGISFFHLGFEKVTQKTFD